MLTSHLEQDLYASYVSGNLNIATIDTALTTAKEKGEYLGGLRNHDLKKAIFQILLQNCSDTTTVITD